MPDGAKPEGEIEMADLSPSGKGHELGDMTAMGLHARSFLIAWQRARRSMDLRRRRRVSRLVIRPVNHFGSPWFG
jgi:hypothetical protein